MREGVAILLLTLSLNGALWGAVVGAVLSLAGECWSGRDPDH
jgi:hypothetical protein